MPRAIRKIIEIDEAKCNGCGQCVPACAEGAIAIKDGKAKLVSEVYCDGLGACLGECPQDAITIREREAEEFDEAAVHAHLQQTGVQEAPPQVIRAACPGAAAQSLNLTLLPSLTGPAGKIADRPAGESGLRYWPVKLRLASPAAPYFQNADLLLVADCVPFAYADFHERLLAARPVVIACPKLDDRQAALDKLTAILSVSSVRSLTVVHMEVPCCSGLVQLAAAAAKASGREIPLDDITISLRGERK